MEAIWRLDLDVRAETMEEARQKLIHYLDNTTIAELEDDGYLYAVEDEG